jgi:hypothetical protein
MFLVSAARTRQSVAPVVHLGRGNGSTTRERALFDTTPVYHYKAIKFNFEEFEEVPLLVTDVSEVWAAKGLGRRQEVWRKAELAQVVIDTCRWHIEWDAKQNKVSVFTGREEDLWEDSMHARMYMTMAPADVMGWTEERTGIFVKSIEDVNERSLLKLTCTFPLDSSDSRVNVHEFNPTAHLRYSGAEFRQRLYWYDPKTERIQRRTCGCKRPSENMYFDYPLVQDLPRGCFELTLPSNAGVEADNPALLKEFLAAHQGTLSSECRTFSTKPDEREELQAVLGMRGKARNDSMAPMAASGDGMVLSAEALRDRLKKQQSTLKSLFVRVRRETRVGTNEAVQTLPLLWERAKHIGVDEILFGFHGLKRYSREISLECRINKSDGLGANRWDPVRFDTSQAWDTAHLFKRTKNLASGMFVYRTLPAANAVDAFPSCDYLMNVGLAVPDPTGSDEARRNLGQMGHLATLLDRWPYAVTPYVESVEGDECQVVHANFACTLSLEGRPKVENVVDTLWLDTKHGFAVRKREIEIGRRFDRVINSHFVLAGRDLWLPKQSHTQTFVVRESSVPAEVPSITRQMTLCFWLVNQVPDELFDLVLAKGGH